MARHQLSQHALGKRAGISQTSVGYVVNYRDENDRHAGVDTIEAIAVALGVEPAQLLDPKMRTAEQIAGVAVTGVDVDTLRDVVEAIQRGLDQARKRLPPARMAEVIVLAYEEMMEAKAQEAKRINDAVGRLIHGAIEDGTPIRSKTP